MRINPLLVATAILYGFAGVALLFAPDEIFVALGIAGTALLTFMAQALGAALFALAMLNWTSRYTITRGILGRPVLMPNLTFNLIAFWMALGTYRHEGSVFLLGATLLLGILALAFASRLFASDRTQAMASSSVR